MTILTPEEERLYDTATLCNTRRMFFVEKNIKVHHHDHVTGKYVAPTCANCNLKLKPRKGRRKDPSAYDLKVQAVEE